MRVPLQILAAPKATCLGICRAHKWGILASCAESSVCTTLVLLACAICQIHMGVKLSQQGISMARVCMMMQRAKIVFIVLNFSLLVNSGILARLCVNAAVPKLHPIALLSMWNSPAFRVRCVEVMLDNLCQKSRCGKEQSSRFEVIHVEREVRTSPSHGPACSTGVWRLQRSW